MCVGWGGGSMYVGGARSGHTRAAEIHDVSRATPQAGGKLRWSLNLGRVPSS